MTGVPITCTEVSVGAFLKWNVSLPRLGDVCRYPINMNPYAPPKNETVGTRACSLCGQSAARTFSPLQRVRCCGCGCLLALRLSERWQFTICVSLTAGTAGLVWLSVGIVYKTLVLIGMTTLFFIVFSFATSIAGQLWPIRNGLFVSKQALEIARSRYHTMQVDSNATHVRTGNELKTSGCDSHLGSRWSEAQ